MNTTERISWIADRREMASHVQLRKEARGAIVGTIAKSIKLAAETIGLPVSRPRGIRMALAAKYLGHPVHSYSVLEDSELFALAKWMEQEACATELKDWLSANFGRQQILL